MCCVIEVWLNGIKSESSLLVSATLRINSEICFCPFMKWIWSLDTEGTNSSLTHSWPWFRVEITWGHQTRLAALHLINHSELSAPTCIEFTDVYFGPWHPQSSGFSSFDDFLWILNYFLHVFGSQESESCSISADCQGQVWNISGWWSCVLQVSALSGFSVCSSLSLRVCVNALCCWRSHPAAPLSL